MDKGAHYLGNTAYLIPLEDWYLLAVLNTAPIVWYLGEIGAAIRGGYLRFIDQYAERLPIPQCNASDREILVSLAKTADQLHNKRRKLVEGFMRETGTEPTQSNSRNLLEQPWCMTPDQFRRRARNGNLNTFAKAHEETAALTEEIAQIEGEIDDRVTALYGL